MPLYPFHILLYPESENTWEKRKDIHPEIVAAIEAKLLHIRSPTHMGKQTGRPPKWEANLGPSGLSIK